MWEWEFEFTNIQEHTLISTINLVAIERCSAAVLQKLSFPPFALKCFQVSRAMLDVVVGEVQKHREKILPGSIGVTWTYKFISAWLLKIRDKHLVQFQTVPANILTGTFSIIQHYYSIYPIMKPLMRGIWCEDALTAVLFARNFLCTPSTSNTPAHGIATQQHSSAHHPNSLRKVCSTRCL